MPVTAVFPRGARGIPPGPLVSRSRRVAGWSSVTFPALHNINDGDYASSWGAGRPTSTEPAWVAIEIGPGPRRVLLNWSSAGSFNYEETDYGSPASYRIETSGDSTDGSNGVWRTVVDVVAVSTHGQAHALDFAGQTWVKFVVTGTPLLSPNGVQLSEIDVHDVSAGAQDCWFFAGDSITAMAFNRGPGHPPSFAAWVNTQQPSYFPAMIDGGTGGAKSDDGAAHVGEWLAREPESHFWAIGYGTNDAAGNTRDTTSFRRNMRSIVDAVLAAGRVPILATIPYASDGQHGFIPDFNAVLLELGASRALTAGPDLYAWFAAHPEELRDGVHPNDRGIVSINRLWGEAVVGLYRR
jgi:lysophospholipase L1-like esterase